MEIVRRFLTTAVCMLAVSACQPASIDTPNTDDNPYAVGSTTIFIHDESRGYDSVAGVDGGVRTLITEIWYPVDHDRVNNKPYRKATYGDYVFGNPAMQRRMMTQTTFFHLTPETVRDGVTPQMIDDAIDELFARERGSYVDAPPAATELAWPVVVMSHGDAGSRYNMESACEYLAAHGYFVVAPEHTGNSPYSMTGADPALNASGGDPAFIARMAQVTPLLDEHGAYGSQENYGQTYTPLSDGTDNAQFLQNLDRSLLQRLNDLRATLRELDRLNERGTFAGRLDLRRIGLTGRSFGGATTIMGLSMEPGFTAGFAVVPPGWADPRPSLPAEMLKPPGEESVLLAADGPFPLLSFTKPTLLLSGAEDGLIIGLGAQIGAMPTPGNPHPLLRQAYETSSAAIVWALLADSNHGSLGVSGSYWWPEMKPNTQKRYFDASSEFTLIAPARAHQVQKELALAFFDLTIREDESALSRLLDNRHSGDGLTLESRNFQ